MKDQPEQKPNILRTLIAVGALTGIFCAWKAYGPEISQLANRAVQPIRRVASNLASDLTKERPNTLYNSATNEVAILKSMLESNDPINKVYAEKRAWDFYNRNLSESLRKNLLDSPMPQDQSFLAAIDYIGSVAGRKQ